MEPPILPGESMNKPEERRKYPRLRREERVVIRRVDPQSDNPAGDVLYCKTVDISPAGMQARAKQQLHPGEMVEVVVSIEGYRDSFHMHGQARWCRPAEDADEFLVGVELLSSENGDLALWRRVFN
ncbi:MAG TPA: PilZ domain-containing protein [Gammaproteobacteria bacterium]|nr:PilZ domain-containing protein [Gammaproteobacteria bacterium]